MYDVVVSILRSAPYNWPLDVAPEPKATERALQIMTPVVAAATLESFCRSRAAAGNFPWGVGEPGSESAYRHVRHSYFDIDKKYWRHDTLIAFGLQHELPEDRLPAAKSLEEWRSLLGQGREIMGAKIADVASDDWKRRMAKAASPSIDWIAIGKGDVWWWAVMHGSIETDRAPFATESRVSPTLEHARVLDPIKFMQNCLAEGNKAPCPWPPPAEVAA